VANNTALEAALRAGVQEGLDAPGRRSVAGTTIEPGQAFYRSPLEHWRVPDQLN
jgi:hypothetical protein